MDSQNIAVVDAAVGFFEIGRETGTPTASTALKLHAGFASFIEAALPFIQSLKETDNPEFLSEEAFEIIMKAVPAHLRLNVLAGGLQNITQAALAIYQQQQ